MDSEGRARGAGESESSEANAARRAAESGPSSGPPLDARALVYVEAARRRQKSARQLARRRDWVASLRLHVEAASLLMRAKLASGGDRRPLDELLPIELLEALLEHLRAEGLTAPQELERLRSLLSAREWDVLDRLSDGDGERAADDLTLVTCFLERAIPTIVQTERRRELRIFRAGMALLASAVLVAALWSLSRPRNLALHRAVSSTPAGWNTSADEAVNGVRYGELGYHSKNSESPWLQVDLAAEHEIHRIQVYGRGDCCFGQSIPLAVEGSIDGRSYVPLGRRDQPFQPFHPWVLTPTGISARYVRVRPLHAAYLAVAELEVY
jgi:F5/8 type C domain-containing protein